MLITNVGRDIIYADGVELAPTDSVRLADVLVIISGKGEISIKAVEGTIRRTYLGYSAANYSLSYSNSVHLFFFNKTPLNISDPDVVWDDSGKTWVRKSSSLPAFDLEEEELLDNNYWDQIDHRPKCECGEAVAQTGWPHSSWCPKSIDDFIPEW